MCFFKYFFSTTFKYNTTKSELFFWKFRYYSIRKHFSAIWKVSNCKFLLNKPKWSVQKVEKEPLECCLHTLSEAETSRDETLRHRNGSVRIDLLLKVHVIHPLFTMLKLLFYDWNNLMIYFNFCCNTIIVVACGIRNSR